MDILSRIVRISQVVNKDAIYFYSRYIRLQMQGRITSIDVK